MSFLPKAAVYVIGTVNGSSLVGFAVLYTGTRRETSLCKIKER